MFIIHNKDKKAYYSADGMSWSWQEEYSMAHRFGCYQNAQEEILWLQGEGELEVLEI